MRIKIKLSPEHLEALNKNIGSSIHIKDASGRIISTGIVAAGGVIAGVSLPIINHAIRASISHEAEMPARLHERLFD